jgi:hypothetical protein
LESEQDLRGDVEVRDLELQAEVGLNFFRHHSLPSQDPLVIVQAVELIFDDLENEASIRLPASSQSVAHVYAVL